MTGARDEANEEGRRQVAEPRSRAEGGTPADGRRRLAFRVAVAAILLLAALLRFWAIDFGLPYPRSRPDEYPVLYQSSLLSRGNFEANMAYYPDAYLYVSWLWGEAGLALAQGLGLCAPGSYVQTLRRHPEHLFVITRSLSAVAGIAVVAVVMGLALRSLGRAPALAAGLLVATSFLPMRDSHAIKPDSLLSLAVVIALVALRPLAERATPRRGLWAGLAVGAAMGMKYTGVLLLAPLYAAAVWGSPERGWRRALPPAAVIGGLAAAALFLLASPRFVFGGQLVDSLEMIVRTVFPQLFPEVAVNAAPAVIAREGVEVAEYGAGSWWSGLVYHARFSLWYGGGYAAALLALPAVLWGLASGRALMRIGAVLAVSYYLVVGVSPAMVARYMTPLIPVLLLLEVGLLQALAQRFAGAGAGGDRRVAIAVVVAAALVAAQPLAASVAHNRIAARTDTRVLATRWLEAQNLPKGAPIAIHGEVLMPYGRPTPPRGSRLAAVEPRAEELERAGVRVLVTHDHELYSSTVDRKQLDDLRPRLRLLVEFDPYTGERSRAVFEDSDPYYIPVHGFSGIYRPGPHIRIYAFE